MSPETSPKWADCRELEREAQIYIKFPDIYAPLQHMQLFFNISFCKNNRLRAKLSPPYCTIFLCAQSDYQTNVINVKIWNVHANQTRRKRRCGQTLVKYNNNNKCPFHNCTSVNVNLATRYQKFSQLNRISNCARESYRPSESIISPISCTMFFFYFFYNLYICCAIRGRDKYQKTNNENRSTRS